MSETLTYERDGHVAHIGLDDGEVATRTVYTILT